MTGLSIRDGSSADAAVAASLHATALTDGFLSSLGPGLLGVLYRRIANDPASWLFLAELDDRPVGFLAGTLDTSALYRRFIVRDLPAAVRSGGVRLLRQWPRAAETLRYPRRTSDPGRPLPAAELLAMAVSPTARQRGAGRALVGELVEELTRSGADAARVTVGAANAPALALYRSCGFAHHRTVEVHRGSPSEVLVWRRSGS